jgi:putative transposase
MQVSASGYYGWLKRKVSCTKISIEKEKRLIQIKQIHATSKGTYGSPRITKELIASGEKIAKKTVAKWMRAEGIKSILKKKYRVNTTDSNHGYKVAENVLNQCFEVTMAKQVWVSDITYIRTQEGWLYLTIIMDLWDRKIIG